MDMIPPHSSQSAALENEIPCPLVGAMDHCAGDVVGLESDGGEEAVGFELDGVALVGTDEVVGWVGGWGGCW